MANQKSPFVGIAGAIGGVTVAMVALIVIFSPGSAWVIAPIVFCMAVLGITLGYFASKKS